MAMATNACQAWAAAPKPAFPWKRSFQTQHVQLVYPQRCCVAAAERSSISPDATSLCEQASVVRRNGTITFRMVTVALCCCYLFTRLGGRDLYCLNQSAYLQ